MDSYYKFRNLLLVVVFGCYGFLLGFVLVSVILASGEPPTPVPVVTPTSIVTPEPVVTPEPTVAPTAEPTLVVTPEVTVEPTVPATAAPTAVPAVVPVDNTTQINALLILQVIGLAVASMALYGVYKLNKIISIWFGE